MRNTCTYFICICLCFSYICRLSIPQRWAGGGRPKAAGPPLWRRPKAASIMGDGKAANISKTRANTYKIYACFAHIVYFMIFSLLGPCSYSISEIRSPGDSYDKTLCALIEGDHQNKQTYVIGWDPSASIDTIVLYTLS